MKKIFYSLIICFAIVGCSNDDVEQPSTLSQTEFENPFVEDSGEGNTVTKADLLNIMSKFGTGFSKNHSRTQSEKDYELSTIIDTEGNPVIYVINYVDNGGFVLVSASKDYHPILAFAEKGHYDILRIDESGIDIWEQNMIKSVKESSNLQQEKKLANNIEWLKYSASSSTPPVRRGPGPHEMLTDEEYEELVQIYNKTIKELRDNHCEILPFGMWKGVLSNYEIEYAERLSQDVYWMYEDIWQDFATLVYYEDIEDMQSNATVQSTWYQYDHYNDAFPMVSETKRAYVGCGPVAAGQIMRYFEYPSQYDWTKMPLHNPTYDTSLFLYEIAEQADAEYYTSGTPVSTQKIRDVFISKGYSLSQKVEANSNDMAISLLSGSPVFVEGWNDSNTGHAWVASQVKYKLYTTKYDIYNYHSKKKLERIHTIKTTSYKGDYYFYYNWGWKGNSNGYFLMDGYSYNKKMSVLLNIKPK